MNLRILKCLIIGCGWLAYGVWWSEALPMPIRSPETTTVRITTLDDCLEFALSQHPQQHIAQDIIEIAERQYKQAQSALWPQIMGTLNAIRMDEASDFLFPEDTATYTITGLASEPLDVQVTIPEKRLQLTNRDILHGSLSLVYPLYTGGQREALLQQAQLGIASARQELQRSERQVVYDVKRLYWGVLLARTLSQLGQTTAERLRATMTLTEQMYQTGIGVVQKTDYLRTRMLVSAVEAIVADLEFSQRRAEAALVYAIGLPWQTTLELEQDTLPFHPIRADMQELLADVYRFNPDWKQMELALETAEAQMREARSERLPRVVLTGSLDRVAETYESGLMTEANRASAHLGVTVQVPLFQGFRTTHAIQAARLTVDRLKQEQILLSEGVAMQIQETLWRVERAEKQVMAFQTSRDAATEHCDLTIRAYQHDLASTNNVLEAQLLEAMLAGQFYSARYEHLAEQARLEFLIGQAIDTYVK